MGNTAILRALAITLLIMNGIPAVLAGGSMITDPSGAGLMMDTGILEFSPFKTFLIPGIILFTMNGLFSFIALIATVMKNRYYPDMITFQGLILTGWITIQIVMINTSSWMQLMYGLVGLILILAGLALRILEERTTSITGLMSILSPDQKSLKR
jgi:hypothetical protein